MNDGISLIAVWSWTLPLLLGAMSAAAVKKLLFADRAAERIIKRAQEVIMTERELRLAREPRPTRFALAILLKLGGLLDLERLILKDMRVMFRQMGSDCEAENELVRYVLQSVAAALPVLAVPYITGFTGYCFIYPVAAALVFCQKYRGLRRRYCRWQNEIIKDLPSLIDKLRIGFASGRNFVAAFVQARDCSGPALRSIIDKLINDLQYMRPAQALDLFAGTLQMPVATKFASAVKIAVEYGYEQAENYFANIESDIVEVRRAAIEEMTKAKPEKTAQLYLLLIILAAGALFLKGWEIFAQVNEIM